MQGRIKKKKKKKSVGPLAVRKMRICEMHGFLIHVLGPLIFRVCIFGRFGVDGLD